MASTLIQKRWRPMSLAVSRFERVLSAGAGFLLVAVLIAVLRGHAQWGRVPASIWAHLATILGALVLTPIMLLRRRGDRWHRRLGYVWLACLGGTAAISFAIRTINPGGFSPIHVLSAVTLATVPIIVWTARTHQLLAHRITVCSLVTGALLIAGFFTFPFHRLLGRWLFG